MTGEPHIATDGAEADPLEGRTLGGKFEIEHLLGSGAMGKVYKARQVALDRPVAIKVMHRQLEQDATYAARFDREAKAASRLDHPNLIRVLDYGRESDGLFYIAMEFLDGLDLFQVLERDWPMTPPRIVDLLSQTLAGLAAAHDAGVLHRDLKPENIMLLRRKSDDGTSVDSVKVCDFGIAKMVGKNGETAPPSTRARTHTTAGFLVGTPEFMSPEQAHGQDLDGRSDVYSVGVILYQLLTGRLPFEAPTPLGVVLKVLHEEPSRPSNHVQGELNHDLEDICMKAIEKDPKDRFADAREMRSAILSVAHDAGYLPPIRTSRASLANAPTMDFAPERAEGSLGPQEVPKRATRGRLVAIATAVAGAVAVLFLFRGRLAQPHDAPATIQTTPTTTTASPPAAADPEVISPLSAMPPASGDPPFQIPRSRTHHPFSKRPATAADPPPQAQVIADPPPVATVPPPPPETAVTPQAPAVTTAPPPTAAIAVRPTFDVSTAQVDLGTPKSSGATPVNVARALSPVSARITSCYRASLNASNAGATSANLHLGTNEDGVITDARVSGLPFAACQCIENQVRGRKIADVDTGNAMADVPLALKPR